MEQVTFKRTSANEYQATEQRGTGRIISYVRVDNPKHTLSDVRKAYKRMNRVKL